MKRKLTYSILILLSLLACTNPKIKIVDEIKLHKEIISSSQDMIQGYKWKIEKMREKKNNTDSINMLLNQIDSAQNDIIKSRIKVEDLELELKKY